MDLADVPGRTALTRTDNAVLSPQGRRRRYAALGDRVSRLANGLAGLGIVPGDRMEPGDAVLGVLEQAVGSAIGGFVRAPRGACAAPGPHGCSSR
jgi:hypothetical protein